MIRITINKQCICPVEHLIKLNQLKMFILPSLEDFANHFERKDCLGQSFPWRQLASLNIRMSIPPTVEFLQSLAHENEPQVIAKKFLLTQTRSNECWNKCWTELKCLVMIETFYVLSNVCCRRWNEPIALSWGDATMKRIEVFSVSNYFKWSG